MGATHNTTAAIWSTPEANAAAQAFIARWQHTTASELATAQSFVIDLCDLLGVPKPDPRPLSTEQLAQRFKGKGPWKKCLPTLLQILQTLQALGRAQPIQINGGEFWRT